MYETETDMERLVLVSASMEENEDSLDELEMLAETSGAEVVGRLIQKRETAHPRHYLGKGKLDELKDYIQSTQATGILCDDELSSSQLKHLDNSLNIKILDRTMVILDIFANRAVSAEGKAQVELAQLQYRLSRLSGLGHQLSRQGGSVGGAKGLGIGARGPGEKKLETDRRHIQSRISQLKEDLREIQTKRATQREKRVQSGIPVIALVGYTNAGKSTLMNAITDANVLAENKLFATLETTTRTTSLPGGTPVLFTDTVGFIHKLPHHLIRAFRATLEELQYATILIHVVDAANPAHLDQIAVVHETLNELHCLDKPMITALNKADLFPSISIGQSNDQSVSISAKSGYNLPALLDKVESVLQSMRTRYTLLIPYNKGHVVSLLHKHCEVIDESHIEEGTQIEAYIPTELCGQMEEYRCG